MSLNRILLDWTSDNKLIILIHEENDESFNNEGFITTPGVNVTLSIVDMELFSESKDDMSQLYVRYQQKIFLPGSGGGCISKLHFLKPLPHETRTLIKIIIIREAQLYVVNIHEEPNITYNIQFTFVSSYLYSFICIYGYTFRLSAIKMKLFLVIQCNIVKCHLFF